MLSVFAGKDEKPQIDKNQVKKLKTEQNKPTANRRKEIVEIGPDANEDKTSKTVEKKHEIQKLVLWKVNEICHL